jgi:hypothetical protein
MASLSLDGSYLTPQLDALKQIACCLGATASRRRRLELRSSRSRPSPTAPETVIAQQPDDAGAGGGRGLGGSHGEAQEQDLAVLPAHRTFDNLKRPIGMNAG